MSRDTESFLDIVWETVQEHLPLVVQAIQPLVPPEQP